MKKYHKQDEKSYALGITLTFELLEHRVKQVTKVYIHSSMDQNETFLRIKNICQNNNIPLEFNDKVFRILSDKENCYVIGEFTKYETQLDVNQSHILLVNPSNAGNLGTIIRAMLGFNITNLAIITPAVDFFDPKVIRASMGAIFNINFAFFNDFINYQKIYQQHHYYPFMLQTDNNLKDCHHEGLFTLIFGNEATGLPSSFLHVGTPLKIVHSQEIDSLNLPMAVTIGLYEFTKNKFGVTNE